MAGTPPPLGPRRAGCAGRSSDPALTALQGKLLGFADDNYQQERTWFRAKLGQRNTADSNELQQAHFSICFQQET